MVSLYKNVTPPPVKSVLDRPSPLHTIPHKLKINPYNMSRKRFNVLPKEIYVGALRTKSELALTRWLLRRLFNSLDEFLDRRREAANITNSMF